MADTFYYSRDTLVHLTDSAGAIYKIPVLDGFSFSQATNATEVTLNEMATSAGVSRRARQMFTDSYAPAEWSFQTYIRPFTSGGRRLKWTSIRSSTHMCGRSLMECFSR
jgi:hypothetical protein